MKQEGRWGIITLKVKGTVLIALLLLLASCESSTIYHQFRLLPDNQWSSTDTLCFEPQLPDSSVTYQLEIGLRILQECVCQEMKIGYRYLSPTGEVLLTDQFTMTVADENLDKTGKGVGGIYEYVQSIRPLPVTESGNYQVLVFLLQEEKLAGIHDIGVKCSRLP